ncbi:MAG: DNA polymerase IV [Opitutales bacterium]
MRLIAHFDADAFFASVEQARRPELRGKVMAVGGGERGIISAASYEARARGVYTPMPTAQAKRLCPELILVSSNFSDYRAYSARLFKIIRAFSPTVEASSIDEGYMDLSHTKSQSAATDVLQEINRLVKKELEISVSWGLASNRRVAAIASKLEKPNGFVVVPMGEEEAFLAPLPVDRLPGLGSKTGVALKALGVHTLADLVQTRPESLRRLLGSRVESVQQAARGIDETPLATERGQAKSHSHQRTFSEDTRDLGYLVQTVKAMIDDLTAGLRRDQLRARALTVKLRYDNFQTRSRSTTLSEASDCAESFFPLIIPMLKALMREGGGRGVRLAGAGLSDFDAGPRSQPLFEDEPGSARHRRLMSAADQVRASFGDAGLTRASLLGSGKPRH